MIALCQIPVFWDDEYKHLNYVNEPFNDSTQLAAWSALGHSAPFTGDMCDQRGVLPTWNSQFIDYFSQLGWKNIGMSYYRMPTGTVLPTHSDLYLRYIKIHALHDQQTRIHRAVVFLQDWQSGHYAEYQGKPFVNWRAGDVVQWRYDVEHMAANLGPSPRYTLQVTGWL